MFWDTVARKYPALANRVVFMSAGAFTQAAQRFLEAGRYRCIAKPFDRQQLLQAISAEGPLPAERDLGDDDRESRPLRPDIRPVQSNG
jgi:CheY-like chemotaxis protein